MVWIYIHIYIYITHTKQTKKTRNKTNNLLSWWRKHKYLPSDPQRTADYQTPVNILGKYDNLVGGKKKSMHFVCPGAKKNLTTDVRAAPIITEQTAKLGRFTNYLQNWVSRGYCFCGQHRLNLSLAERACVSSPAELVGQTNQQICSQFSFFMAPVDAHGVAWTLPDSVLWWGRMWGEIWHEAGIRNWTANGDENSFAVPDWYVVNSVLWTSLGRFCRYFQPHKGARRFTCDQAFCPRVLPLWWGSLSLYHCIIQ